MFTRIVSFTGATDIDAGVRYLSGSVDRLLHEQKGFAGDILPQMKETPGFQAARYMINRQTGDGRAGSFWSDRASMLGWEAATEGRRRQERQRGVTFVELSEREIVFADLR